jgi:carbon storage regulator
VLIGPDITVIVVDIRGDKVRLGFNAPNDVSVDRREVRRDKERAAIQAPQKGGDDERTA